MAILADPVIAAVDALIEANAVLQRRRALATVTRDLTYDRTARRYRRGRRLLTQRQQVIRRNAMADDYAAKFARLVERYASGSLTRGGFELPFVDLVSEAATVGYAFGCGGLAEMTDADWGTLGIIVAEQEAFARRFFADIQTAIEGSRAQAAMQEIALPRWTVTDGIINRARQYADVVVATFERSRAALFGLPLPEYPPSHPNCRCSWERTVEDGRPVAYWRTVGDACPICRGIANRYQPWRAGQ